MIELAAARAAFPALASGFVYLDNAGGSQTLATVADAVRDYLLTTNVQLGASYAISARAGERVAAGVRATAAFIGAGDPHEVVIGGSTTQLLANLALASEASFAPGDELVVSVADHQANVGPWLRLAARRGLAVRRWPLDAETGRLEVRGLAPLLGPRTKLVAFPHVSNLLGSIHDVAAITRLAHEHGARVCVDGVAYAPHRPVDVRAWDVDYYVFSFYKVYGPHLAMLYGKRALLEAHAGINHDFIHEVPYKLQPGNLNFELSASLPAIYDYLAGVGFAAIAEHEERLSERLLAFLRGQPRVTIHGEATADRARRVPTISFSVAGASPEAIVRAVDGHGIGIRHGNFYAVGLELDVIRVSAVHYNTLAELDRLIGVLAPAIGG